MNEDAATRAPSGQNTAGDDVASSADDLLRSLESGHLSLSAVADQKAGILVGATMVVPGVVAPIDTDDTTSAALIFVNLAHAILLVGLSATTIAYLAGSIV